MTNHPKFIASHDSAARSVGYRRGEGKSMKHVIGLSGGKDSTALALRLAEVEPRDYDFFCTPTGDELPSMTEHWAGLEKLLGKPLIRVSNQTLDFWINHFKALPNWRQRWCTRLLKIEPTIAWLTANAPVVMYVGLRADEEDRVGIYGDIPGVTFRYPFREWGWGIDEVWRYLADRGVKIPARTDCARCYGQRLIEWKNLWREHPELYADAERQEAEIGATFRSPGRDAWPAQLVQLKTYWESQQEMFAEPMNDDQKACRVCSL